ncbi:hypothetical protein [Paenibacillus sp. GbtcB18]|uniref:hypothetical protein n=1 Tax=Paenibacillus sp. GbtcB18 TaxID=2824763 RepID=UPI001C30780C|nr:hypothetical protein [Paenibacillus sp. GbtcB18]
MMSKLLCDSVAGKQAGFRQPEGTAAGRKRGSFSAAVYRASLLQLRLYGITVPCRVSRCPASLYASAGRASVRLAEASLKL